VLNTSSPAPAQEVSEIKWVGVDELGQGLRERPHEFTPWFLHEARMLGWC